MSLANQNTAHIQQTNKAPCKSSQNIKKAPANQGDSETLRLYCMHVSIV